MTNRPFIEKGESQPNNENCGNNDDGLNKHKRSKAPRSNRDSMDQGWCEEKSGTQKITPKLTSISKKVIGVIWYTLIFSERLNTIRN